VTNLGGTSAHELVDALLAALRTLHHLVGAKNQTFKFFAALLANILENGHCQSPLRMAGANQQITLRQK
jgi:radical SAM superfamily enzyme with C-terminal helix-hairpin-helix motif